MVRKRLYIVFGGVRGHTLPIVFPYSSTTSLPKNELDSYLAPVFLNHSPSVPKKKKTVALQVCSENSSNQCKTTILTV